MAVLLLQRLICGNHILRRFSALHARLQIVHRRAHAVDIRIGKHHVRERYIVVRFIRCEK
ncbi:hypothetical protein SDC9_130361 [bioreactor metagenome]|uniref:Uncharacterized protein n=1 Tax=bioreactor metagenome TaxID=1076179 RepID=A0A645D2B7_9ZZZZ